MNWNSYLSQDDFQNMGCDNLKQLLELIHADD